MHNVVFIIVFCFIFFIDGGHGLIINILIVVSRQWILQVRVKSINWRDTVYLLNTERAYKRKEHAPSEALCWLFLSLMACGESWNVAQQRSRKVGVGLSKQLIDLCQTQQAIIINIERKTNISIHCLEELNANNEFPSPISTCTVQSKFCG